MGKIKLTLCSFIFVTSCLFVINDSFAQMASVFANSYFESEERSRVMFEESPIPQGFVSQDGKFLDVNYAFTELVGYTENELLRLSFEEITHPNDVAVDRQMSERVAKGDIRKYVMYKRYLGKWSEIIRVKLTVQGLYDQSGNFHYYYVIIEPILIKPQNSQDGLTMPAIQVPFGEKIIVFFNKNWKILIPWAIILYVFLVKVGIQWRELTKKQIK